MKHRANTLVAAAMSLALFAEGGPASCAASTQAERLARELRCNISHQVVDDPKGGEDLVLTAVLKVPDGATVSNEHVTGAVDRALIRGGGRTEFDHPGASHTVDHNGSTSKVNMTITGILTANEDGSTTSFEERCPTWLDLNLVTQGDPDGERGSVGADDAEVAASRLEATTARAFALGALTIT